MTTRNDGDSNSGRWPFRDLSMDAETTVTMNQRMIGQLLRRETKAANLPAWQSKSLISLGIEVTQSREANAGVSLREAAKRSGLDPAFLAILEAGKAVPEEITPEVLRALARGVKAKTSDLKSAMYGEEAKVPGRTRLEKVIDILILWWRSCPGFLGRRVNRRRRSRRKRS